MIIEVMSSLYAPPLAAEAYGCGRSVASLRCSQQGVLTPLYSIPYLTKEEASSVKQQQNWQTLWERIT